MTSTQTAAWPASGADPSRSPFMLPPIDGAGHAVRRRLLQRFLADAQPAPRPVAAQETYARRIAVSDASRVGFVIYLVSVATGVDASEITATTRLSAEAARARQIAMYLTHVGFSWPISRVGIAFGRDRSTASHACHRVEDLRDTPEFDAALDHLEACVRAAPALNGLGLCA